VWWGAVLVSGFLSCEIVLLQWKVIFALVCLKRFMIFLMCGDTYVKVAHLMLLPVSVSGVAWAIFLLYLLFQSDDDDFWEVVILCDQQYGFPFLVLSVLVKREGEHSFYVVLVCC